MSIQRRLANASSSLRHELILSRLREAGHVSVSALAEAAGVTEMTIRRDLRRLSDEGLATLVHGGARLPVDLVPLAFASRAVDNAAVKQRLGRVVARELAEVPVIGIDAGTTTLEVALQLPREFDGTVVTNSVPVLAALTARANTHTIGIGGDLIPETQAMASSTSLRMLENLRMNVFVLGANSLDAAGAFVHTTLELDVKRAYVASAARVILMVDSSKVQAPAAARVCSFDSIDEIVTDAPLPSEISEAAQRAETKVTIC